MESYGQPRQHIKKQRHYFSKKGPSSQSYGFSSGHVWKWELGYKQSWVSKNVSFWSVVLEKTLESPLGCKGIWPIHPKGDQSWVFIVGIDVDTEIPIVWPPDAKRWLICKDPHARRDRGQQEKGTTEDKMVGWHHWHSGHTFGWTLAVCDKQGGTGGKISNLKHEFSSVHLLSHVWLFETLDSSILGFPIHSPLPELTHVYRVRDSIQPSHSLSSLSPPAFSLSQHQDLFQCVYSSHEVAKVLGFQHQSSQWIFRTDVIYDGLVGSPCCPRASQVSSPTPQFKIINSSAFSFVCSSTLISMHDCWKNHIFDWRHFSCKTVALKFLIWNTYSSYIISQSVPWFSYVKKKSQFSIVNNSLARFLMSNVENSLLLVGDSAYRFK